MYYYYIFMITSKLLSIQVDGESETMSKSPRWTKNRHVSLCKHLDSIVLMVSFKFEWQVPQILSSLIFKKNEKKVKVKHQLK